MEPIITIFTAGTSYRGKKIDDLVEKISLIDDSERAQLNVRLQREPTNEYDKFAVRIYIDHLFAGYIPRKYSQDISTALEKGVKFTGKVISAGNYGDIEVALYSEQLKKTTSTPSVTPEKAQPNLLKQIITSIIIALVMILIIRTCA